MPIILIIISFFLVSSCHASSSWVKLTSNDSFSIKTQYSREKERIYINYCFIFNKGRIINCMDNQETVTLKRKDKCYTSNVAYSARTEEKFPLSICFHNNHLIWKTKKTIDYIPNKIVLSKAK